MRKEIQQPAHHDRLSGFRDSTGAVPSQWPKALLPSITAIIRDPAYDGAGWKVLIHHRADNQHWGFPGGGQHIGESIIETVHREVIEETGVRVDIEGLACIDSDPQYGALSSYDDGIVHYTNLTFLCTYISGEPHKSLESISVGWATTDRLPAPFLATHAWRLAHAQTMTDYTVSVR
jgi:8-oxo-dGTP pyrophosphatase MutT (NUDIX family)